MKIAIVGAGFLGLACSWHLSHLADTQITLFDSHGIGAGASGIAAGLLHPFAGAKATLNWKADVAFPAALELLEIANQESDTPLLRKTGIFRPAITSAQKEYFIKTAEKHPECQWQINPPGLFIPMGVQVDCPKYLEALWKACTKMGAQFVQQKITSPDDLSDFDFVVFTVGVGFREIDGITTPQYSAVKGQLLELSYPDLLPHAIVSKAYIAQMEAGMLIAGSTYEHSWNTPLPDLAACEEPIRNDVRAFNKELADLPLLGCKTGFRAATPDKKPFLVQSDPRTFCLGGLGSKGLLYHAYLAKTLLDFFQRRLTKISLNSCG